MPALITKSLNPFFVVSRANSPEDESVEIAEKQFRDSPKFSLWVNYFLDKENKYQLNTFGNQVQSAIHAYKLDPVRQYKSASVIAHQNLDKLRSLAGAYLSKQGLTYGTMLDIAASKMAKSHNPQWWMIVAELMGLIEAQGKLTPVQQTTQINISADTVVTKEEQDRWDKEFLTFLESRKPKFDK